MAKMYYVMPVFCVLFYIFDKKVLFYVFVPILPNTKFGVCEHNLLKAQSSDALSAGG